MEHLLVVAKLCGGTPVAAGDPALRDAPAVTRLALAHGLGAATFLALEQRGLIETWDPASCTALQERLVSITGANLRRARQLTSILKTLESKGITALAYKGPTLAWLAYGHIGARIFGDLDLLVAPADRAETRRTLEADGYMRDMKESRLGAAIPAAAHVDRLLPASSDDLPVEVHSSVAAWRMAARLPAAASLARRVPCRLPTGTVSTLSTEDTLVALCVHASTHRWQHLRFACEIAGIAARFPVEWAELRRRATEARVAREVRVGVLMVRSLCGTAWPADVLAWATDDTAALAITADRIDALVTDRPGPARWQSLREHLRYREGLADKWQYAARNELIGYVQKLPWERWRRT